MNSSSQMDDAGSKSPSQHTINLENLCRICLESKELLLLHEACNYCSRCILNHTIQSIKQHPFELKTSGLIKCPSHNCDNKIPILTIITLLSPSEKEALSNELTKIYAIRATDVLSCPSHNCNYVGYLTPSHTGCNQPFTCENCQTQFAHPIVQLQPSSRWKEVLSFLTKAFTTKKCPHCGVRITKMDGCDNMVCGNCRRNFKWSTVSYSGWKVVMRVLLVAVLLLCAFFYREIWHFVLAYKKNILEITLGFIEAAIGLVVLSIQIQYHLLVFETFRERGCMMNVILSFVPFAIEYIIYSMFPTFMRGVFFMMAIEIGFFGIVAIYVSCSMAITRAYRRRPHHPEEQIALVEDFRVQHQEPPEL